MQIFDTSQYFSSAARARVLEALLLQDQPIPLRHVEYISNLSVRAVELTLKDFHRERLIKRKKVGNKSYFSPNKQHPHFGWLKEMLLVARKARLIERAASYKKHVEEAVDWANSAIEGHRRMRELNK